MSYEVRFTTTLPKTKISAMMQEIWELQPEDNIPDEDIYSNYGNGEFGVDVYDATAVAGWLKKHKVEFTNSPEI
jgi:hypothetical protein